MRILITGAHGQVGQSLQYVRQTNNAFAAIELIPLGRDRLDICNQQHIDSALDVYRPKILINAAAYTAVDHAESDSHIAFQINQLAAQSLALACAQRGIRMIHLSTDYVFNGQQETAYAENATPDPINTYGQSKLAGELAVLKACASHIVLRTSWIFSAFGHNFFNTMMRLAQDKPSLSIIDDQYGCPTYGPDLAHIVLQLAQNASAKGIYHYAGQPPLSWYQFAKAIFHTALATQALTQIPILTPISSQAYASPAQRPTYSVLGQQKIQDLGLAGGCDWQSGILACLAIWQARHQ